MALYDTAEDARKKRVHGIEDTGQNTAAPTGPVPDYTSAAFFEIGRGSTTGQGAVRRGLLFNGGAGLTKTALAWEFRDGTGTPTGRLVQCANVINGDVNNAQNVWAPLGGSGGVVQILAGLETDKALSVEALVRELAKKQDKPVRLPGAAISASNPARRFGDAVAVTVTYTVAATDNPITAIKINGASRPLVQNGTVSYTTQTALNTAASFTLVVETATESANVTATVTYYPERFWFVSSQDLFALSDADITTVILQQPGELASSRQQSRTFTPSQEFIYFYWPAAFGVGSFVQNGLPSTAYNTKNFTFTNANGYAEAGLLTRSLSKQGGTQQVTAN